MSGEKQPCVDQAQLLLDAAGSEEQQQVTGSDVYDTAFTDTHDAACQEAMADCWHHLLVRLGMAPLPCAPPPSEADYAAFVAEATGESHCSEGSGNEQKSEAQQQLNHLSFHAAMALMAVSSRRRSEWSVSEAETVRLFFRSRGAVLPVQTSPTAVRLDLLVGPTDEM